MIYYKDGTIDNRDIFSYYFDNMGNLFVTVYNEPEKAFDTVQIGTKAPFSSFDPCSDIIGFDYDEYLDYLDTRENKRNDEELKQLYKEWKFSKRVGKDGFFAAKGDIVEVVKGRKYPKGTRFTVTGFSEFTPQGTYGHGKTFYINFDGGRVNKSNVVIVDKI